MQELAFLDATAQADLVRRKKISADELVEYAITRIEQLNPALNAVVTRLYEQARAAVGRVNAHAPLAGVPLILKDLLAECAGTPLSEGSRFLGDYVSTHDSELVRRFHQAGLIVIAKSNTPEFALMPTTEPSRFGATRNPWDTRLSTGGSSGGSAAAVASGMVAIGHANDGGGSIRVPASCCGVVGLKPTRGRNSLAPDYGDVASGLLCEHVHTRSVRDTAAVLDATAGPTLGDPYWPAPPERLYTDEVEREPGRLRIALSTRPLTGVSAHDHCIAAGESVARLCESLGHEVFEAAPEVDSERLFKAFGIRWIGFLTWAVKDWARRLGREPSEDLLEPATWRMYANGLRQTSADYLLAVQDLQRISRDVAGFFEHIDVWLTPTLAQPPVPLGYFDYAPDRRATHLERLGEYTGFTLIANTTGQPAISLPLHWTDSGLPIGVQFTGRYGDEATLLRLAGQLERAQPWAGRRPPDPGQAT
ncbi:MAG: amidase [Acidiferrobacteraceae bacterium]|jgi:amidase|nr:amidase [Acidiferrobacteraceae bacterium]HJP06939.1 amidase [Arenicellales bacterium]|tara:strand:- start:3856 stop:5289 length:1434 start_codon:yes stop_codon:yes gene_type:complete